MTKVKWFAVIVVILLGVAWGGIRYFGAELLEVTRPARGEAVLAVYATGTVEATVMMPIAPRMSARLAEIIEDEGHSVTKGQVLARLEDEDMQSSLRQFQAQEKLAEQTYRRKATLIKSGSITKADFDSAKAEWELAKAQTARAATETNFMKLIAPDDGEIIKRDGEIGQLIPAGQPVFWLRCCAPLRITSEVNEEDIALVKPQQDVLIRADAFGDKIFKGKVTSITPKGDPVARTYRVRIEFAEKTPLQIGMTAETNIMISKNDHALLVPISAVQSGHVWLVRDNKLLQQAVKLGAKGEKNIEILSGVKDDDSIVLQPSATLHSGDVVRTQWVEPK